jgi:hypothetical protein
MSVIDDVLKVLDRIPIWKRLQEVPSEVDELKAKVAALEEKLGGKWPADVCRFCGERAARLGDSRWTMKDMVKEDWDCAECGSTDSRYYKASTKS